jgi:hypothetical protein
MQIECHGQIVRGTRPNSGRTQLSEVSWLNCAAASLSASAAAKIVPWAAPENSSLRQLIGKFWLNDSRGRDSSFWLFRRLMNVNGLGR